MKEIELINQEAKLVISLIEEWGTLFNNNEITDAVNMRIMNELRLRCLRFLSANEEIIRITDEVLASETDEDRLNLLLKMTKNQNPFYDEDIV